MSHRYAGIVIPTLASVMLAACAANNSGIVSSRMTDNTVDYQQIVAKMRGGVRPAPRRTRPAPTTNPMASLASGPRIALAVTPADAQEASIQQQIGGPESDRAATTLSKNMLAIHHRHAHTISIASLLVALGALGVTAFCIMRLRRLRLLHRLHLHGNTADYPAAATGQDNHDSTDETTAISTDTEDSDTGAEERTDADYRPYENRSSEYDRIFLSRLDALIAENMAGHELNVDFLAAQMLVSRSLLFRRVKRITGRSVVEYINDRRITRAIELLRDGSYNLTEISELVGYSSLRYFSRVFKSATGELPSTYRLRIKSDEQTSDTATPQLPADDTEQ